MIPERNKIAVCVYIILFPFFQTTAQGIAIGQWRDHLPYQQTIAVTESASKVYCATPYNIFVLNKGDNSIERLSKINGLSEVGISTIRYHQSSETLVIAYTNGNIDLKQNNEVYNMADIERSNIIADKRIYNILFIDHDAYLACGFGIVVLDLDKKEIKDTYLIGPDGSYLRINDLAFDGNTIFAASEQGIYSASVQSGNLSDYNTWIKHSSIPMPDANYNLIVFFDGKIYANRQTADYMTDSLYVYNANTWSLMTSIPENGRNDMKVRGDKIVIANDWSVDVYDKSWNNLANIWSYQSVFNPAPSSAVIDDMDTLWIADKKNGLVKNWNKWNVDFYLPQGPASINTFFVYAQNGNVWIAPGGISSSFGNLWNQDGISHFDGSYWHEISKFNTPVLDSVFDIVSLCVDPMNEKRLYAATLGSGVLEFEDDVFVKKYDETNSALHSLDAFHWVGITKVQFDQSGNLWATNTGITSCLAVKTSSGNWLSYDFSAQLAGSKKRIKDLAIDNMGQKWMILSGGEGLLVFNDNGTLTDLTDDQSKMLNTSIGNGGLPSAEVYSIAVDKDGEMWVGTDKGIAVFYSPENVFSGSAFDAEQILIQQDGYTQILMETEIVSALAIDGANRKWIGTLNSGAYLLSADGTEEIYHFSEDNSPLFSNHILSIAIDQQTGEVFFGTIKGLISFRGTATEGADAFDHVTVFPNPVYPDFNGLIAINGLVANADVKITDISGNIVYQTTASGGQATWDGRNFEGQKAQTGIYLVFASNADGSKTMAAKILFVN